MTDAVTQHTSMVLCKLLLFALTSQDCRLEMFLIHGDVCVWPARLGLVTQDQSQPAHV